MSIARTASLVIACAWLVGCSSEPASSSVVGVWANDYTIVTATDTNVFVRFQCLGVRTDGPLAVSGNAFSVSGNFVSVNTHGTVTISGTVSPNVMNFTLVPGTAPSYTATHQVLLKGASFPRWYPNGALCAD